MKKLTFVEGEIDFIAAANLLPHQAITLRRRPVNAHAWTQIKAASVPDLDATVDWALHRLGQLRDLAGR